MRTVLVLAPAYPARPGLFDRARKNLALGLVARRGGPLARSLVLGATLLLAVGCSDEETPDKGGATSADGGADDTEEDVPCPADYPVYHEGITAKTGDLTVKLLSVSPMPPRQQTPNTWLLEVDDAAGAPATGFAIQTPDSYMPVHGHHGKRPPKAVLQSEPGRVQLTAIDFSMRGPWQVNFDIVPQGGKAVTATLPICVQ